MTGALAELLVPALSDGRGSLADDAGRSLSAPELLAQARQLEQALLLAGVRAGEPVQVTIDNRCSDLAALLGVWLAGAVAVPVHREAPPATVDALRRRTSARAAIDAGELATLAELPTPGRLPDDAALVLFTSGTTGQPKGVVIGHQRLAGKLEVLRRLLEPRPDDRVVLPLRLTFVFGIWVALLTLWSGGSLALLPRFSRTAVRQELMRGPGVLAAVPTILRMVMVEGPAPPAPRTIITGGELLPVALGTAIRAAWPEARLVDLYGSTETGSCDFCLDSHEQPDGFGTIGRPTEGVACRIIGEEGRPVRDGASGELHIKSPFGMLSYLDQPELTSASFSDGFFRTGDLAGRDAAGRVRIVGRIKEIISRGGTKIAPAEVEALLTSHPAIDQALSAGIPDPLFGETVHALVVIKEGARLDLEALARWMASRVERSKLPDAIHPVEALPVGPTGKLDRQAVARIVAERSSGRLPRPGPRR